MVLETKDVHGNTAYEVWGEEVDLQNDGLFLVSEDIAIETKCTRCGFRFFPITYCDMFPCMRFQRQDSRSVVYKEVRRGEQT